MEREIYFHFVPATVSADAAVVDLSVLFSDSPDLHYNDLDVPCPSVAPVRSLWF